MSNPEKNNPAFNVIENSGFLGEDELAAKVKGCFNDMIEDFKNKLNDYVNYLQNRQKRILSCSNLYLRERMILDLNNEAKNYAKHEEMIMDDFLNILKNDQHSLVELNEFLTAQRDIAVESVRRMLSRVLND